MDPELIARHLRPGTIVALADGAGAPLTTAVALTEACRLVGGVHLLLGWSFGLPFEHDHTAFTSVRTLMGGQALRPWLRSGAATYVPTRLGSTPALLAGPLRPDAVIVSAVAAGGGLALGHEVGWMEAAMRHARIVLAEVNRALPAAARDGRLPAERTVVVNEVDAPAVAVPVRPVEPAEEEIGTHVADLLPTGCTLQFAPGAIGTAVLQAVRHPVVVDSGLLTDDVVGLDERGMLRGTPTGGYLIGTERLARWADGRRLLAGVEHTHDPTRLGRLPAFVAVNTALQIDPTGQVNVEGTANDTIAGIGGQADYALGATRSEGGLSIVAMPTTRNGRPTLVERLDRPASTGRSDIGVVVTERGVADLRGVDDAERAARIRRLWDR